MSIQQDLSIQSFQRYAVDGSLLQTHTTHHVIYNTSAIPGVWYPWLRVISAHKGAMRWKSWHPAVYGLIKNSIISQIMDHSQRSFNSSQFASWNIA